MLTATYDGGSARPEESQPSKKVVKKKERKIKTELAPNFPYKNALACTQLITCAVFKNLKPSTRSVLAYLIRVVKTVSATDAVWPGKKTIAEHVGMSKATVDRHIAKLEEQNLIRREMAFQVRNGNGRWSTKRIHLTETTLEALNMLGSNKPGHRAKGRPAASANASDSKFVLIGIGGTEDAQDLSQEGADTRADSNTISLGSDKNQGAVENSFSALVSSKLPCLNLSRRSNNLLRDQEAQSLQKHSPQPKARTKPASKLQAGEKFVSIPSDLKWLVDSKILTARGVCRMMGEFTAHGKRLSDVVAYMGDVILKKADKGSVWGYLLKLAQSETDFAWKLRVHRESQQAARKAMLATQAKAKLQSKLEGCFFVAANGRGLYQLERGNGYVQAWELKEGHAGIIRGATTINDAFIAAVESKRLKIVSDQDAANMLTKWGSQSEALIAAATPRKKVDLSDVWKALGKASRATNHAM